MDTADKDDKAMNEFIRAASNNNISKVETWLEDSPQIINSTNKEGETALHLASKNGYISTVQLLLDKGADPNLQTKTGYTALHLAAAQGYTSIVQLLLQYGAYAKLQTKEQERALDCATSINTPLLLKQTNAMEVHTMLKDQLTYTQQQVALASALNTINFHDITIRKRINSKALSSVYRGKYRGSDVAIKMLRDDLGDRQRKEIEIMSKLRHPRLVLLMGVAVNLDHCYGATMCLVTEFMARGSLYSVLHHATTAPEYHLQTISSKLRVLKDVVEGMHFLHCNNVIHCDLKSPNILLDEDGRAKISDFGMSQILPPNISNAASVAGTPAWMSPESLLGEACGVRQSTDVYSFGVILWEILTNCIPWENVPPFQIAIRISQGESLSLPATTSRTDTPAGLVSLLEACLKMNPDHRPTFAYILDCLSEMLPACIEREGPVPCPDTFICPISNRIMNDPVICSDGHTYDRASIEHWLLEHDTSPLNNMTLDYKMLQPNIKLRAMIQEYREEANSAAVKCTKMTNSTISL